MASLCPSDPFHLCSSFRMRDQCTSGSTGCHLVWFFLCIVPSVLITLCFPNFLTTSLMTLTFQCVCSRSLISHSVVKYFFPVTRLCCCAACISSLENGWNMMSTSCVPVVRLLLQDAVLCCSDCILRRDCVDWLNNNVKIYWHSCSLCLLCLYLACD